MNNKSDYSYVSSTVIWIMSLLSGYLTAHRVFSIGFALPFALWYVYLQYRKKEKGIRFISGCLVLVSGIADLVFHHPVIFTVFRASAFLTGFLEGVRKLYDTRGVWKKVFPSEHAKYVLRIVKCIVFTLVFIFLAVIDIYPDLLFRGQTGFNKTTYPAPEELNWEGYALRTNLQYGDTYPNSIFDLMTCDAPKGTVIWIHGGNYLNGDKGEEDYSRHLMLVCLEEGYDVVSMNHAFAPAYRFPVPLLQLDELIGHLKTHEKEYGINTKKIILAGSGSGADIAVQYAAASGDPAYIDGIKGNEIAGLYLASALYSPQYGADTGLILSDYITYHQLREYYGKTDLSVNQTARTADVMPHITPAFPPALLSDGNTGTYGKQARRFAQVLEENGVPHEALIFDSANDNKDLLERGFDTVYSREAAALHGKMISFLRSLAE